MKNIFYGGFALWLITILAVVIRYPQNNLIPGKMFLYTLVWVGILGAIKITLSYVEGWIQRKGLNREKISRTGFVCYVILYGVLLYIVSLIMRSYPVTDYGNVYHTAYSLATGQTVEDWTYFSMWTNNLGNLSILTFLMKIGLFIGFEDPFYFVLGVNVLQVVAVLVSLFYLSGQVFAKPDKKISTQWLTAVCFTLWTPVWTSTKAFYSDQLSFGGSIIAMALILYACNRNTKKRFSGTKWLLIALAGFIWGISISAKATAGVGVIALAIVTVWAGGHKTHWKEALILFATMVLGVSILSAHAKTYPSVADEYRLKTPTEYWIAMGLVGDGTYKDNAYLIRKCNFSQTIDERRDVCRIIIKDNWTNLFDKDHVTKKTSVIFGAGDISPTDHIYPEKESVLWHFVYWEGDYYWKYACLSTGFFFAVLLLLFVGALRETFRTGKQENRNLLFMIYLVIFGLFLFLMLWEAQNKQLYNHISWMTLGMVAGLESLEDCAIIAADKLRRKGQCNAGK